MKLFGKQFDPQVSDLVPKSSQSSYCYFRQLRCELKKTQINFLKSQLSCALSLEGKESEIGLRKQCYHSIRLAREMCC